MNKEKTLKIISLILCLMMATATPCHAAYYYKTAVFASVPEAPDESVPFSIMQGMVATSKSIFTIKSNSRYSAIYKTNLSDKNTVRMVDATTSLNYNDYLGKGDDIAAATYNGNTYLYVIDKNMGLTKLLIQGTTYKKVANYKIAGAIPQAVSISTISQTATDVTFLLRYQHVFYIGTVGLASGSGTINVQKVFSATRKDALVNGKVVPNLESYTMQGIEYYNGKLYLTLWGKNTNSGIEYAPNVSIILVYDGVSTVISNYQKKPSTFTPPTLKASSTSFQITSTIYSKYEIEGCNISMGTMYFNVNRANSTSKNTAICYFTDY